MVNQRTLKSCFSLEGKGLHTGLKIHLTFNPAPENHGYKIRRVDVPGQPIIDALAENVTGTQRGTVLSANGVQVSTVEHAMAALYACEIDNCLIDVDGPEFPILDGSSILFVSKIKEVGTQQQSAIREYISIKRKKIKVVDKTTGSSMLLVPDESFSIQSQIAFNSTFLRRQDATMNDISEFTKDFASARTFVFVKEIEPLLNSNLVKGGDLDNAIVIYDKPIEQQKFDQLADMMGTKRKDSSKLGYIMNKPLLYPNEPARHKLLDIIGDLALVGHFIKGKVIANCPGHKINNLFARAIREAVYPNIKEEVPMMVGEAVHAGYYSWSR
ncbi:UDP-3-O-[3-hydroxymyristoyl] N-acetylglucosamine deacetylase [Dysgonomonas sp. 521]|nr:UDP-3-O-[3-hydroxymyristoyl] N-acetylglucosamine deacetylase [Dysgonomonas sp. 521]